MTKNPRFLPNRPRRVAMVAFDDCQILDVVGPLQTFATAGALARHHGAGGYAVGVYTRRGGALRSSSGLTLVAEPLRRLRVDGRTTLMLAGGQGVQQAAGDPTLLAWLRGAAPRVERVCSVCSGAFLLAATGLVDGRRIATHWELCDALAARHPRLRVDRESIFVRDGRYWTSAGVTAGIDLALALVEADGGRALAMAAARQLVVFFKRPGGQGQFSDLLAAQARETDRFADLHAWMSANLAGDLGVEAIAARASMSTRNFYRRYTQAMGVTPAAMVERMRVEAARRLLEDEDGRIDGVARAVGFASDETMRRAFVRRIGVTPGLYRRNFTRPDGVRARRPAPGRRAGR